MQQPKYYVEAYHESKDDWHLLETYNDFDQAFNYACGFKHTRRRVRKDNCVVVILYPVPDIR